MREVREVHAERRDDRNLRVGEALPGFHRLDVIRHAGDRAFDEGKRIDAENA
jgi:hypothetical protein